MITYTVTLTPRGSASPLDDVVRHGVPEREAFALVRAHSDSGTSVLLSNRRAMTLRQQHAATPVAPGDPHHGRTIATPQGYRKADCRGCQHCA